MLNQTIRLALEDFLQIVAAAVAVAAVVDMVLAILYAKEGGIEELLQVCNVMFCLVGEKV
jgi:hypothetical protein